MKTAESSIVSRCSSSRGPAEPPVARSRRRRIIAGSPRLHARRAAVADEEARDQQEAADHVEAERDRRGRAPAPSSEPERATETSDRDAPSRASTKTTRRRSAASIRRLAPVAAAARRLAQRAPAGRAHLVGGHRPALERVVARGDVAVAERRRAAAPRRRSGPRGSAGSAGGSGSALGGLIGLGTSPSSTIALRARGRARGSGSARPRAARPCTGACGSRVELRRARRSRRPCRGT